MTLLILGVALWWAAHLFKRVAPQMRAGLGDKGRGMVAGALFLSIILMVLGYRSANGAIYWGRETGLIEVTHLLMIFAFYLFAASGAKGAKIWLGTKLRHPMLTGVVAWSVGHLLVNGDTESFVLFGGMGLWALVQMVVINAAEGPWQAPPRAPARKEIIAVVITLVVTAVVVGIHSLLGVTPW